MRAGPAGRLLAISDLHVGHAPNRALVEALYPEQDDDWLIVAGDVGETVEEITWALRTLAARYARVVWTPGNHELWTHPRDPVPWRGEERYLGLVAICRELGVATPEDDPYPVWPGPSGPVVVAPVFTLYDYSFAPAGARTLEEGLAAAARAGVTCTDELLLDPAPYPSRQAWCAARVDRTRARLDTLPDGVPVVLAGHFPLVREPTQVLRHQEFAQWCGTVATADWHRRYRVAAVVHGHLHLPRRLWVDGVRFEEVSLGYPREWGRRGGPPRPRRVLPWP